jgi:hypothetical protein
MQVSRAHEQIRTVRSVAELEDGRVHGRVERLVVIPVRVPLGVVYVLAPLVGDHFLHGNAYGVASVVVELVVHFGVVAPGPFLVVNPAAASHL